MGAGNRQRRRAKQEKMESKMMDTSEVCSSKVTWSSSGFEHMRPVRKVGLWACHKRYLGQHFQVSWTINDGEKPLVFLNSGIEDYATDTHLLSSLELAYPDRVEWQRDAFISYKVAWDIKLLVFLSTGLEEIEFSSPQGWCWNHVFSLWTADVTVTESI